jgi:5'-deoxy-5'-methylthioadenosine phosphorylase
MTPSPLGIVAGTGFYDLDALRDARTETVTTAFGDARVTRGTWHGIPVVFLTRHGTGHSVPPHLVNYRANIRALVDLGCRDVVAVNVTGSIDPDLRPGDLLCLDDFLDLTRQRAVTFFDGTTPEGVVHTDVLEPYHPELRREILDAAAAAGQPIRDGGVYACFEGPRFETRAEIRLARLAGAHVAGMTGVPEVTLAAEAGLRYAAISLVVNPASGVGDGSEPITMAEIDAVLRTSAAAVLAVLDELVHTRATFPAAETPTPGTAEPGA